MPIALNKHDRQMNRQRFEAVARAIAARTLPDGTPFAFDMTLLMARAEDGDVSQKWNYSAGCIAGFAALMFGRPQDRAYLDAQTRVNIVAVDFIAQHALDLTDDEASELFYAAHSGADISKISAEEAAQTLRYAAATGTIRHRADPSPTTGV